MVESPSWHSERRRVQWHCPRAPTPEPGKGRRPKNRHSSKAKRLLPVLACLCWGFPGSGSLVLPPCSFGFLFVLVPATCFFLLAAGVTFQLPAGGTSGQAQGHRPENRPFLGIPFRASSWCSFFLFLFALSTLFYYWRLWPFPRCKSVHRVCQASSIFSGARVLPGDWGPSCVRQACMDGDPRTGFHRYPPTYDFDVYLVAPDLFFPFSFAILFVVVLVLGSLYPSLLQLTHSPHLRRLHSVSRHTSFGWP